MSTNTESQDWQVYDREELRSSIAVATGSRSEVLLGLDNVHCAACVARVRKSIQDLVPDPQVDLSSRTLRLSHDPARLPLSQLLQRLDQAGFSPQVLAQDGGAQREAKANRQALARIGIAVIGAMQVMMLAWPGYFGEGQDDAGIAMLMRWAQLILATPVVFYSGWPFLQGAWQALRTRSVNMDVPVAASLLIAWGASTLRVLLGAGDLYFDAATMFVMLLGGGRYLEGRTRAVAGARLRLLAARRALTAVREDAQGQGESVPIARLALGDVLRVAPGETLPADGELLDDFAALDESLLSGEARPVTHHRGEVLAAGSLNVGAGVLRLRVSTLGQGTMLSHITRLLAQAQAHKPKLQLIADRIAGRFVLIILALALLGAGLWWHAGADKALSVALAVLVASCPCALSLATPAVFAAAASRLAGRGVLLANPAALERVQEVQAVLFDKTGTLTHNALQLQILQPLAALDETSCRRIVAALERDLLHPIARALAQPEVAGAQDVRLDARGGVSGSVDGADYWLGAPEHSGCELSAYRAQLDAQPEATWLLLRRDQQPLALLALSAVLRSEARETVAALQSEGLRVELLSGDGQAPTEALAQRVGIGAWRARQTPEQKLARLRELQQHQEKVMAVGDGSNDAPFLAAADVALAMPSGTALAQARADAILIGDSLQGIVALRQVSAASRKRIRENLSWAFVYNLVMLPLALGGLLTPWLAALGMSLSSLIVVGNALRLGAGGAARSS